MITYNYELNSKKVKIQKPVGGTWSIYVEGHFLYQGVNLERDARRLAKLAITAPEFQHYFKQ
jgi:hypothetical protein